MDLSVISREAPRKFRGAEARAVGEALTLTGHLAEGPSLSW